MSVQFLATQSVRHIGVWTATNRTDEPVAGQPLGWTQGRYRAICGGGVRRDVHVLSPYEAECDPEVVGKRWVRRAKAAMRRPVCRRCLAVLDDINEILGEQQ